MENTSLQLQKWRWTAIIWSRMNTYREKAMCEEVAKELFKEYR